MRCKFGISFRTLRQLVAAVFALAIFNGVCRAAPDRILYDVHFNGPPHVVGMTPAFGGGPFPRDTPTSGGQIFAPSGSAEVVASFGELTNRPVRLTAIDGTPAEPALLGGVDLQFDLTSSQLSSLERFHASVDVLPTNLSTASGLGIFFDAPAIHSVQFGPDGNIRVIDATGLNQVVASYIPDESYHVRMAFDRSSAQWSTSVNGTPLYVGPADDIDLETFRIAMTTGDTSTTSVAYVDNIRVTVTVPEPGAACLAGMVVAGWVFFARRRRTDRSHCEI